MTPLPQQRHEEAPRVGASSRVRRLTARVRGSFTVAVDGGLVEAAPAASFRTILRRFWPDLRPFRALLAVGLVLIALAPILDAAQIWLFKVLVDDVLVPGDLGPLVWLALVYVGLAVAGGIVSFADEYVSTSVGERFLLAVRTRVYRHLQRQSLDVLDRRRLGDLLARLTADVQAIESFLVGAIPETISALLRIAVFTGVLVYLQWDLALVSLLAAPLLWLAAHRFGRRIQDASRQKRRRSGSLGAVAEEGLANAPLVQTLGREDLEAARFAREGEAIVSAELVATRWRALFSPLVDLIELVGGLVVVAWGAWAIAEGRLTIGGLLAFLTYLALLYSPLRTLGDLGTSLFSASAAAERVLELLDHQPSVTERPGGLRLGRARGEITFERVYFAYPGATQPVLRGFSLRVDPGTTVALAGSSGTGKTTLAKLLLRFYDPQAGVVRLDGHDLRDLTLDSVRSNVALLLQDALVFDATIRENIRYGRPEATEDEMLAAARAAGIDTFVDRLPHGYDTRIGQKGRLLSGGQRQRVAIARTLLRDSPVVVLDEPSAGLDAAATRSLMEPLRELMQGRTTILISHDPLVVADADQVITVGAAAVPA